MNKDKVIKALDKCIRCDCDDCTEPYASHCVWDCVAYDALVRDAMALLKEQAEQIERLEEDLAVTQNNLNYYVNGND